MKVAVVGATGLVGNKMMEVLQERHIPVAELIPVASTKQLGREVVFQNRKWPVVTLETALERIPDFALFSAGAQVSLDWAPKFAKVGCTVIDNSSAWRMAADVPLVVPEINMHAITPAHRIIANPNCSTIQMVMALCPLHRRYRIKRVVVSTYQSVSGSGQKGINQLLYEQSQTSKATSSNLLAYTHPINLNLIPQIDLFLDNGYTKEEMKMVNETRKILEDDSIAISATTVRVPVMVGHCETVNVGFHNPIEIEEVNALLRSFPGVVVERLPNYPMPLGCAGRDEVFVGRIRLDPSAPNAINMWIVADNLRKGAATNAVQILEGMIHRKCAS